MNAFFIVLFIFIIVCLILIWYINVYNKFQNYLVRINEVEANIDTVLRKRFDLLNKSINIIKANIHTDQEILELIVKLRSRKLSNFELDRQLYEAMNEFNYYLETYPTLKQIETITKIHLDLIESEHDITAYRKYYNDIITEYNKMVKTIPTNFIAKMAKYKEKTYYDGKNMNDDIINDFKL